MPETSDIVEVTAPVEFVLVDDRLHFILTSGGHRRTFAITFHKARGAAHEVTALLNERDRAQCDRVWNLKQVKGGKGGH